MAVEKLGRGVNDDVGAVLQRTLKDRCCERVVDDDEQIPGGGEFHYGPEIYQSHHGVRGGLDVDHFGGRRDCALEILGVALVDERETHAKALEYLNHEAVRSAIEVLARDDVISRGQQL